MSGMNDGQTPESQWILRCQHGDAHAFADFFAHFQKPVYLLALRMTGDYEDAEDIAQETFIRAFRHVGSLDPTRNVRAWLLTVALNLCRNHRRAAFRRWRLRQAAAESLARAKPSDDRFLRDQMQRALEGLKPKSRAAVVLVWLHGMSHREAGQILGCSEGTVSWRLFNARETLRRELGPMLR